MMKRKSFWFLVSLMHCRVVVGGAYLRKMKQAMRSQVTVERLRPTGFPCI